MVAIYLDNAATTFPKPPEVWQAMLQRRKCPGRLPAPGGSGK
ncbi:hypothetical protein [Moorella sulfitireducens (nom. illeg.)]|nr:hypothetical protein [Moorella sulfitireducens]